MILRNNIKEHNFNILIITKEATNQHIRKISEGSCDTKMFSEFSEVAKTLKQLLF